MSVFGLTKLLIVLKAEEAAAESRLTKQDRYAEMRRRKDEEREAKERMLVGCLPFLLLYLGITIVGFLIEEIFHDSYRRKKPRLDRSRRRKLLHWSLTNGKESFQWMLKDQQEMICKTEVRICCLILWNT